MIIKNTEMELIDSSQEKMCKKLNVDFVVWDTVYF